MYTRIQTRNKGTYPLKRDASPKLHERPADTSASHSKITKKPCSRKILYTVMERTAPLQYIDEMSVSLPSAQYDLKLRLMALKQ
jgi:hypothetical protein